MSDERQRKVADLPERALKVAWFGTTRVGLREMLGDPHQVGYSSEGVAKAGEQDVWCFEVWPGYRTGVILRVAEGEADVVSTTWDNDRPVEALGDKLEPAFWYWLCPPWRWERPSWYKVSGAPAVAEPYRKKCYAERQAELEGELAAERPEDMVPNRLRWEDWGRFRPELVEHARGEIERYRWRGAKGGVLPGGLEAEDIVDGVVGDLIAGKLTIALGWVSERLLRRCKVLIDRRVRELHELVEAGKVRSEWEMLPVGEDGEEESVLEKVEGRMENEEGAEARERLLAKMGAVLAGEPELKRVFTCMCAGMKSAEIAERLGMTEAEVINLRKRLRRKIGKAESRKQR